MDSQIKYDTGKASLITLPHQRHRKVWIPNKLIYDKNSYAKVVYLNENFIFHGVSGKHGKAKFEISGKELIELLENTTAPNAQPNRVEVHVPPKIKAKEVIVDESLKR